MGDTCEKNPDCSEAVNNSVCTSLECDCDTLFLRKDPDCLLRTVEDVCTETAECDFGVTYSVCSENKCICPTGSTFNASSNICKNNTIDDVCSEESDCSTTIVNSTCDDTCKCVDGFYAAENKETCILRKLGEECTSNSECIAMANTECSSVCVCNHGYYEETPSTCRLRKIGTGMCDVTNPDCTVAIANSHCATSKLCECDLGYKVSDANTTCILLTIEDTCTSDEMCATAIPNSRCASSGICECVTGYMSSSDKSTCTISKYRCLVKTTKLHL